VSVDVLDPSVRVTITEEAHLFEDVLRHGDFHSDFVVDAMLFNRSRHNDAVHTPLAEAEIDEFVSTYGLNQQVSDEEWFQLRPSRMRRFWNWLTRKHVSEDE
jgi:hypothetical protein